MAKEPSSCGCDSKCSAEVQYFDENITTSSPKIAARIRMAYRNFWRFSETSELLLWAQTTNKEPEIAHQIEVLYDFSRCPNIVEYVEKFENWKGAVARIREDLERIRVDRKIEIIVKIMTAKSIKFKVGKWETVENLKLKIQDKEGIAPDRQRLIFEGKQMQEERTLDYYEMEYGSTIQLIIRISGPPTPPRIAHF